MEGGSAQWVSEKLPRLWCTGPWSRTGAVRAGIIAAAAGALQTGAGGGGRPLFRELHRRRCCCGLAATWEGKVGDDAVRRRGASEGVLSRRLDRGWLARCVVVVVGVVFAEIKKEGCLKKGRQRGYRMNE